MRMVSTGNRQSSLLDEAQRDVEHDNMNRGIWCLISPGGEESQRWSGILSIDIQ